MGSPMRFHILFVPLCLAACGDKATTDSGKPKPGDHGDSGTSDSGGGGDGGDGGGTWTDATVKPGAYEMTVQNVTSHNCAGPLEAGMTEVVQASRADAGVALWGFARMETNGEGRVRANGTRTLPGGEIDCVLTETVTSEGPLFSSDKFTLDVDFQVSGTGTQCAELPVTVPCASVFAGSFEWVPPQGGDTGGSGSGGS